MSFPPAPPPPPPFPSQFSPLPPPVPNPGGGGGSFRALANYSWASVLLAMVLNMGLVGAAQSSHTRADVLWNGIFSAVFLVSGLLAGIIALFAIRKYGRKGLLWPALTGVCLWLLLTGIAVPNFLLARQKALEARAKAAKAAQLAPVAHIPDAVRVSDAALGFSFELPPDYMAFPADKKPAPYQYAYLKQNPGKSASVVVVEILPGTISPVSHLTEKNLPAGKGYTLTRFSWRGLDVDGVRIPESIASGAYVTLKAQIPIKQHAIQLGFGGPEEDEKEVRALAERVLSTLDGPVSW